MLLLLLPISICSVILLLWYFEFTKSTNQHIERSQRRLFLISLLIHSGYIFLFNEIFSLFNGITRTNAVIFWTIVTVIELALAFKYFKNKVTRDIFIGEIKKVLRPNSNPKLHYIIYAAILLYGIPLFALSIAVPPNNFDAHSYHLTRIIEWLGNQNIAHFPTRHIQQLYHNVFAEYIVMHTFLLTGSDQFAGLVQFFASVGTLLAATLIVRRLGGSYRAQILAAILLLTLPIGIFESTTVQVDYVACFFFSAFLYFGFEALDRPRRSTLPAMAFSLAFGAFSKYTIFMFALPFSVYFGFQFLFKKGFAATFRILALFAFAIVIIFTPFLIRNYQFFGNVLHPVENTGLETEKLSAGSFSVGASVSGVIKNASLHLGLPILRYNAFVEKVIIQVHEVLGYEVNKVGMDYFTVRFVSHEDMVPNNMHFILIVLAILALLFMRTGPRLKWFAICGFAGFAIFSSMMVFQLWSTRTHMPFFALGCILAAIVMDRILQRNSIFIAAFLLLTSISFVIANPSKPLLPLRYYSKKIMHYTPVAICPETKEQERAVVERLSEFYVTVPNGSNCFILKQDPTKDERKQIFSLLDSLGYYNGEKYESVFAQDKSELYFLNHPANYDKFEGLLKPIQSVKGNIGVLFKEGNGYYHYWSASQNSECNFRQMKYIGYRPRYAELPNAKKQFSYQYILGDDMSLLNPFYRKQVVDTVITAKGFYLAKLKHPVNYRVMIDN